MASLLLTGALTAVPALAHGDEPVTPVKSVKYELGGFLGWHVFDGETTLGDKSDAHAPDSGVVAGVRGAWFFSRVFGFEGELAFILADDTADGSDNFLAVGYRAHARINLTPEDIGGGRLFLLAGGGGLTSLGGNADGPDSATAPYLDFGLGAHAAMGDDWGLRLQGLLLTPDFDEVDWEATVGLYTLWGGGTAAPIAEHIEEPGPGDRDSDGIADERDGAPDDAEDKDGFQDDDGVPDPDNDDDGVADKDDGAPDDAEDKDGFQDDDGVPDRDNDKDGITDAKDKAPDDAEDKDGFEDDDGAPDLDNDGDGVADSADKCPKDLETKNGYQDGDGCADEVPAELAKFSGKIDGVQFETGKATIKKASFKVLDKAVAVLLQFPEVNLEIQGHTDDVGDDDKNLALSQSRADAVRDYLISKGVDANRLRAVGYGETKPVDSATTGKARAKNRRVEFLLISP